MSEYEIINLLHEMTLLTNVYKIDPLIAPSRKRRKEKKDDRYIKIIEDIIKVGLKKEI